MITDRLYFSAPHRTIETLERRARAARIAAEQAEADLEQAREREARAPQRERAFDPFAFTRIADPDESRRTEDELDRDRNKGPTSEPLDDDDTPKDHGDEDDEQDEASKAKKLAKKILEAADKARGVGPPERLPMNPLARAIIAAAAKARGEK